jgi:hypothetical protein
MSEGVFGVLLTIVLIVLVVLLIGGSMWGCPKYNIYMRELRGKAALQAATWDRKIAVEEANAKKDAAIALAAAEVERAKGVAEANKIIGDSLKGNDDYLRYLWIQGLQDGSSEVIYIPTETQLPILEAGRLLKE